MRAIWFGVVLAVLLAGCGRPAASGDEAAIRSRIEAYLAAWNNGDADALAAFYDEDGDRVSNSGTVFRGRDAIRNHYLGVFASPPPEGLERKLTYGDISIRIVAPGAAVVDVDYELVGYRADIDFTTRGRTTVFMIKHDGEWWRTAHRNSLRLTQECFRLCAGW